MKCIKCGTYNADGISFCCFCGASLDTRPGSVPDQSAVFCPVCGRTWPAGSTYCSVCGAVFSAAAAVPEKPLKTVSLVDKYIGNKSIGSSQAGGNLLIYNDRLEFEILRSNPGASDTSGKKTVRGGTNPEVYPIGKIRSCAFSKYMSTMPAILLTLNDGSLIKFVKLNKTGEIKEAIAVIERLLDSAPLPAANAGPAELEATTVVTPFPKKTDRPKGVQPAQSDEVTVKLDPTDLPSPAQPAQDDQAAVRPEPADTVPPSRQGITVNSKPETTDTSAQTQQSDQVTVKLDPTDLPYPEKPTQGDQAAVRPEPADTAPPAQQSNKVNSKSEATDTSAKTQQSDQVTVKLEPTDLPYPAKPAQGDRSAVKSDPEDAAVPEQTAPPQTSPYQYQTDTQVPQYQYPTDPQAWQYPYPTDAQASQYQYPTDTQASQYQYPTDAQASQYQYPTDAQASQYQYPTDAQASQYQHQPAGSTGYDKYPEYGFVMEISNFITVDEQYIAVIGSVVKGSASKGDTLYVMNRNGKCKGTFEIKSIAVNKTIADSASQGNIDTAFLCSFPHSLLKYGDICIAM